jgi:hypothetical protein
VVPPSILQVLIDSGWVMLHPLAGTVSIAARLFNLPVLRIGRFHAVSKCTIPETLVFYRAPRTETEMDHLWNYVILPAYQWIARSSD